MTGIIFPNLCFDKWFSLAGLGLVWWNHSIKRSEKIKQNLIGFRWESRDYDLCLWPTLGTGNPSVFILCWDAQLFSYFACLRGLSFNHNINQNFWRVKSDVSISISANIQHTSDLSTRAQQCSVFITIARLCRPSHPTPDLWRRAILSVSPSPHLLFSSPVLRLG